MTSQGSAWTRWQRDGYVASRKDIVMEYEDLVEGYEDSLLAPFVAIGRELRATVCELGLLGVVEFAGCVALMYGCMWVSCLWAAA